MKNYEKTLSIFSFQQRFPDQDTCLQFLAELKWERGYQCIKCGHHKYCQGRKDLNRQCTACKYEESPTANTLFHKVKFPLYKAFWILYYIATTKRGMSASEMSRKLKLNRKTCWSFRRKAMLAMKQTWDEQLEGFVEMLPLSIKRKALQKNIPGEQRKQHSSQQRCIFAIERSKSGVCKILAQAAPNASRQTIRSFFAECVAPRSTIRTSKWFGVPTNDDSWDISTRSLTNKKQSFYYLLRTVGSLKNWIGGVHGEVTYLQAYLDEFCYRFNHRHNQEQIFDDLLARMMKHPPCPYHQIQSAYE